MYQLKKITAVVCATLMSIGISQAQVIFSNDINDSDPSVYNPFTLGQIVAPNLTVSGIGRGSGLQANAGSNRYNARNWNSSAFDSTKYFTFTLTPSNNYQINFESFTYSGQASGSGPTNFAFRSSLDGFTSNLGSPSTGNITIDLSATGFQGISNSIEFRLYAWGASGNAGTFSVNSFEFNGDITAVPEPHTYILMLGGVVVAILITRRRRRMTQTTN